MILSNRLDHTYLAYASEYEDAALRVLRSGRYILGEEVNAFEKEFADYIGPGFSCVGLASGFDSLRLAVRILDIGDGDEVIVQSNAYMATVTAITDNRAIPVFAEPENSFFLTAESIKKKISVKTKAIIVTHLYGIMTPMNKITELCNECGLYLIEDCAQAHGCSFCTQKAGSFGTIGCFSFYPTKNLGAFGDGGAVTVKDECLAEKFRIYRNYGFDRYGNSVLSGVNSRLDELQAALLRVKLTHLEQINKEKKELADFYLNNITNPKIILPSVEPFTNNIWHQFVIRSDERDNLKKYMASHGIETTIHYPVPPHLSPTLSYLGFKRGDYPIAEKLANSVLSLPTYIGMTDEEKRRVVNCVNSF